MAKKNSPEQEIINFRHWAKAGGAEIQGLTNIYELVRIRVRRGVAIVYRKANGARTWNDLAAELRVIWKTGVPFPAEHLHVEKVRHNSGTNSVAHKTLLQRDGDGCFFCFEERPGDMTIEHLVPRVNGGPDHIANKFRACSPCNVRAGHLSAPEKIRIREANLLARAATTKVRSEKKLETA